jgi:hypothetical protein
MYASKPGAGDMYIPCGMLKSVTSTITAVIELFVRSYIVDVAPTDTETLSHACAGPGAQMHAAASSRSFKSFPEKDREALDRVPALADALREELVIWDVATIRGKLAARRRGVRQTPTVVLRTGTVESLVEFEKTASELLRARPVPSG